MCVFVCARVCAWSDVSVSLRVAVVVCVVRLRMWLSGWWVYRMHVFVCAVYGRCVWCV